MAHQKKNSFWKLMRQYPYMIAVVGIAAISVAAQILIVFDILHPIMVMEVDAVTTVMSTCSEVIAGLYGITLTGYIFFADRFQNTSKEDESLYDVVQALLIRYNRMAGVISLMTLIGIVLAEGIVLYGNNTLLPPWAYRFWVDETLLFFFCTFNFILYFVISVLDPQKIDRITTQKKDKISNDQNQGDLQQFLTDYRAIEEQLMALMEKLISSSLPIPGRGKKPQSIYTLETLRNYSRISFQMWRRLEQLRQYYNLTLHDPNMSVSREMCDLATQIREDLEKKNQ